MTAARLMRWAVHPGDHLCHAIDQDDLALATVRGYAEALCSSQLPTEGLEPAERPRGNLCIPCAIGAADDLVDPGRMGTAL